jgi:large subunit ribosomal protein L24
MINRTKKIKSNDQVQVISGKYKGTQGVVQKVLDNQYMIVSNVNVRLRHYKSSPTRDAGIVEINNKIHVSNIMLLCTDKKPTRVKFEFREDKKVRVSKRTGEII